MRNKTNSVQRRRYGFQSTQKALQRLGRTPGFEKVHHLYVNTQRSEAFLKQLELLIGEGLSRKIAKIKVQPSGRVLLSLFDKSVYQGFSANRSLLLAELKKTCTWLKGIDLKISKI